MYSKSRLFDTPAPKLPSITRRTLLSVISALNPYPEYGREIEEEILRFTINMVMLYPFIVRFALFCGLIFLEIYAMFSPKGLRPFSMLSRERRLDLLESMLQKGPGIRRNLVRALKALVQLAYYEHPSYIKKTGYSWAL